MAIFKSHQGILTAINDFETGNTETAGCFKLMSVQSPDGSLVNFVATPATYFVHHSMLAPGDRVIGFYDANAAAPLIFPPQFRALVMAQVMPAQNVKADFFNQQLISRDGTLRLNPSPYTRVLLENGQAFTGTLANRNLIIVYGAATMSIPALTTPYEIVVMCRQDR